MKQPTGAGFCWFGRLFHGVDQVVCFNTRLCGYFTGWTKNKRITNKQKVEGRKRKTRIPNSKTKKGEVFEVFGSFKHFVSICYGLCENSAKIHHSHQKCWVIWSSSSLLRVFILDSTPRPDCSGKAPRLRLESLTHFSGVSFLTDNVLRPFFLPRMFTRAQLFVWSLLKKWT